MAMALSKQGFSPLKIWKILILLFILQHIEAIYSPYYKRCRINKRGVDADATPIQDLEIELLPNYPEKHMSHPIITPEIEINYTEYNHYFHQFIDSGGSGEVYLIEDIATGEGKIAKRYFKEKPQDFRRENYLMKHLNYPIEWTKYCQGVDKCSEEDTDFHTVSLFPHKQSIIFRSLEFDAQEAPLIFYKVLKEMDKIHRAGIIHNDIKMGNLLVNSIGLDFKLYEIQFIDWNLALFYYTGLDTNNKKGTVCFYSPEQLLRTQYVTPARDIWSLGVLMFTFYTGSKPFTTSCKENNLKAVATLIGAEKLLALNKKYNYNNVQQLDLLIEIQTNKDKYPQMDLYNYKPKENQKAYSKLLVDVFNRMFEPDPQRRATAAQLMKMQYFRNLKTLPEMYLYRDLKKLGVDKTKVDKTKVDKTNVDKNSVDKNSVDKTNVDKTIKSHQSKEKNLL